VTVPRILEMLSAPVFRQVIPGRRRRGRPMTVFDGITVANHLNDFRSETITVMEVMSTAVAACAPDSLPAEDIMAALKAIYARRAVEAA
jgi:hypothetical protein